MVPSNFDTVDDCSRPPAVDEATPPAVDEQVERWVSASAIAVVMIAGAAALLL